MDVDLKGCELNKYKSINILLSLLQEQRQQLMFQIATGQQLPPGLLTPLHPPPPTSSTTGPINMPRGLPPPLAPSQIPAGKQPTDKTKEKS